MTTLPLPPEPHRERLSISLLLLWTTMSAVLLGLDRATGDYQHSELRTISQWIAFCYAPLFGAGATAVLLMLWRVSNDGPMFPSQPGHWLLVIGGVTSVATMFLRLIVLSPVINFSNGFTMFVILRCLSLVAAAILCPTAIKKSQGIWKAVFVGALVVLLINLVALVADLFFYGRPSQSVRLEMVLNWGMMILIIMAAIRDRTTSTLRDDLHWVGIVVRLVHLLLATSLPFVLPLLRKSNP